MCVHTLIFLLSCYIYIWMIIFFLTTFCRKNLYCHVSFSISQLTKLRFQFMTYPKSHIKLKVKPRTNNAWLFLTIKNKSSVYHWRGKQKYQWELDNINTNIYHFSELYLIVLIKYCCLKIEYLWKTCIKSIDIIFKQILLMSCICVTFW